MPSVYIVLKDDQGNPMPDTEQFYPLDGSCDTWKIRSNLNTDSVSIRTPIPIESERRFRFNLNGDFGAIRTLLGCS